MLSAGVDSFAKYFFGGLFINDVGIGESLNSPPSLAPGSSFLIMLSPYLRLTGGERQPFTFPWYEPSMLYFEVPRSPAAALIVADLPLSCSAPSTEGVSIDFPRPVGRLDFRCFILTP